MVAKREVTETTEAADSVTLKRSVKGVYSWDIKVYFEESAWLYAVIRIGVIDERLKERYLKSAEPEKGAEKNDK